MNPFQPTPEMLELAKEVVWFQEPGETLRDPIQFLAYAMRFGTIEDLIALDKAGVNLTYYREVLDNAPPGIFDNRSWAYWNLRCGRKPAPPLPVRKFE